MAVKIPQNVLIEDKLVGPLTLKQFLYLLGGGSIIFIAYQYYAKFYLYLIEFVLISLVAAFLTIAFAFAKVNGRPFSIFVQNLFKFIFVPKVRSWHKEPRHYVKAIKIKADDIKTTKEELHERKKPGEFKTQIEKLANILDTGGRINENDADAITTQVANIEAPTQVSEPEKALGVEDVLKDTE